MNRNILIASSIVLMFGFAAILTLSNKAPNDTSISITPTQTPAPIKRIEITLGQQTLSYYSDDTLVNAIKISSGLPRTPTPIETFTVLDKIPTKDYIGKNLDGTWYDLKNTQWNLRFSNLGYYIHGAYWHNNFGHPMSHGCINVSYADMPQLYEFADLGTLIVIKQ